MKPLTRYAMGTGMNIEPHMAPWPEGPYYRVDQVDAVIRELTRQCDNAQQFLDECSVSVAELSEQVAELEAEREALDNITRLQIERLNAVEAERDAARAEVAILRQLIMDVAAMPVDIDAAIDAARSKP